MAIGVSFSDGKGDSCCGVDYTNVIYPIRTQFKILDAVSLENDFVLLRVKYLNCETYNGEKLLLYYGFTESELRSATCLDPHFLNMQEYTEGPLPVARFLPNEDGERMARIIASNWNKTDM